MAPQFSGDVINPALGPCIGAFKHHSVLSTKRLPALRLLMSTLGIPMQFASGMVRGEIPTGPCFRTTGAGWYFCYRLQYRHLRTLEPGQSSRCLDDEDYQLKQLNPMLHLHLADENAEIHGARVSVFIKWDEKTKRSTAMVQNSIMGFKSSLVTQPISRLKEKLQDNEQMDQRISDKTGRYGPLFVLITYVAFVLVHWHDVLDCFQNQIQRHVRFFDLCHLFLANRSSVLGA
jgi:hypothetical protein